MHAHQWTRRARTALVESSWIRHYLDTVELPSGKVIEFHALEFPRKVVGVLPVGEDGRILLTLQYRYMTNAFSWEIPACNVDEGEDLLTGARRELLEETGCSAEQVQLLYDFYPQIGRSDHHFHIYIAHGLRKLTEQLDPDEVAETKWFTTSEILGMFKDHSLRDGFTAFAILLHLLDIKVG